MESSTSIAKPVPGTNQPRRLLLRTGAAISAVLLVALLVTASRLEPDASGLGTHQQLGLPPCSIRVLFGIRCPSCGMTTSWAHFANGSFVAAAHANLGGMLLAVYSLSCIALACRMTFTGQLPNNRTIQNSTVLLGTIASITLIEWAVRLLE